MTAIPDPIMIFDLPVHPLRKSELVSLIDEWAGGDTKRRVYNLNVHATNIADRDPSFAASLRAADLVYCDGAGVILGARLLGHRIPERLSVMDWFDDFLEVAAANGRSLFLLGDDEAVVLNCARAIRNRYPRASVVGAHHGFFDVNGPDNQALLDDIVASHPDIVLVGMGMPRQERWIDASLPLVPATVFIPVGAAYRWYTNTERPAPRVVSQIGMEWAWRLIRHPIGLFGRYVVGNLRFALRVVRLVARGNTTR